MFLKGVELNRRNARRQDYHRLYVTDTRDIDAIKNDIIESLNEFLLKRFLSQEDDITLLKPFVNLQHSTHLIVTQSAYGYTETAAHTYARSKSS